jgi:hypothetical protein
MNVRVFISWSGEPSQSIARVLVGWLPAVAQHVVPWMSDLDVESGARWNDKVAEALDQANFGIVCVTASNQHQPWLMFEAGALAKHLDLAHLVPLCVDLAPAAITGPLEAFQGRRLDEAGMRRLVHDLMALRDPLPAPAQTDQLFEAMWPLLESKVSEATQQSPDLQGKRRTPDDMLEELVERVRRLDRNQSRAATGVASLRIGARATDKATARDNVGRASSAPVSGEDQSGSPSGSAPDPP